jgi:hypothetical protein
MFSLLARHADWTGAKQDTKPISGTPERGLTADVSFALWRDFPDASNCRRAENYDKPTVETRGGLTSRHYRHGPAEHVSHYKPSHSARHYRSRDVACACAQLIRLYVMKVYKF